MDNITIHNLRRLQASFHVLQLKMLNYHWSVQGQFFFEGHKKFEEYYNQLASFIDETAERNLMIGGVPLTLFSEFSEHTFINEEMFVKKQFFALVNSTLTDFKSFSVHLHSAIYNAGEERDDVTQDLLVGMKAFFDKEIWMLSSYLAEN